MAASNIVDWDLHTEDGVFSLSQRGPLNAAGLGIDPSLWGVFVRGSAFSATSTDLSFNFGSELNDLVLFQTTPLGSGKEYYCLAANTTACITAATESLQIPDYTPTSHQSEARSGVISIGTVAAPPVINEIFKDGFETMPVQVVNQNAGLFDYTCLEFPTLLAGAAPPALTIEFWYKPYSSNVGTILERHEGSPGCTDCNGFSLVLRGGAASISWIEDGTLIDVIFGAFVRETWHHLAIQRAGDSLWAWRDGVFEKGLYGLPEWGLVFPNGISTHIGCDSDESSGYITDNFRGSLDEVRI